MRKRRPSAEVRVQEQEHEINLYLLGWWKSERGWRHRRVDWVWPMQDALRLETEAADPDHRRACIVCRELAMGRAG